MDIAYDVSTGTSTMNAATKMPDEQFRLLLSQLDKKFLEFRKEVRQDQQDAVQRVAKRSKLDKPHIFRLKGNEDHYFFNEKVAETMCEAENELEKASTAASSSRMSEALKKATAAVKEGKGLVIQHQKHIKLADHSEHSWKVVQEYEMDDLANDSDDKKRIIKAEKAAEKKAALVKKKLRGEGSCP